MIGFSIKCLIFFSFHFLFPLLFEKQLKKYSLKKTHLETRVGVNTELDTRMSRVAVFLVRLMIHWHYFVLTKQT